MKKRQILEIIDLYERGQLSKITAAEWAEIVPLILPGYASRPPPYPVEFLTHEHRLRIYTLRAGAGVALSHPLDRPPPLEHPKDEWHSEPEINPDDDEAGGARLAPAHARLRSPILVGIV